VNANEIFDAWDVPLRFPISVDGFEMAQSTVDGTYQIPSVAAGAHSVSINVPIPQGCTAPPAYTWAGDPGPPGGCYGAPRFRENPQTVIVTDGQTAVVDFIGVPFKTVAGWVWKDGIAPGEDSAVAISAGTEPCWPASLDQHTSPSGALVTKFDIQIDSFVNPVCVGSITLSVDGERSEFSLPWSEFWKLRMYPQSETLARSCAHLPAQRFAVKPTQRRSTPGQFPSPTFSV
jgi:hypothetical protein